jgi:glycosyltransferase involved in cell wall biosynthesis
MVEVMGLQDVVFFDGWQSDVNSWLEDKHFIVSGSIGESQGMGLLEGMACGLKPVIHNFPGASEIFPQDCLFNIAEEFCDEITSKDYDSSKYRAFVEERYPLSAQLRKINQLFGQLETEIEAESVENSSVSEPVETSVSRVQPSFLGT